MTKGKRPVRAALSAIYRFGLELLLVRRWLPSLNDRSQSWLDAADRIAAQPTTEANQLRPLEDGLGFRGQRRMRALSDAQTEVAQVKKD